MAFCTPEAIPDFLEQQTQEALEKLPPLEEGQEPLRCVFALMQS